MTIFNKLVSLEKEASDFGFQWETSEQIMQQIQNEWHEVNTHLIDGNKEKLQEELGDLLHAVFSLCVFCDFDPHNTVEKSVLKFERRFRAVQAIAKQKGLTTLLGKPFNELMALWETAKNQLSSS